MRERWRGLAGLCILAILFLLSGQARAQEPEEAVPQPYVVVKLATGPRESLRRDGVPPTLAEEGFRVVPVPPGKTVEQYLAGLRTLPLVESAEADGIATAAELPNDPYYTLNQAQYLGLIGAPAAWDVATGNKQVVIAFLDTGTDLGHPEFAGRLWENTADAFNDGVDHDGNGCINDRYGCRFVSYTSAGKAICGYDNVLGQNSTPSGNVQDDTGKSPSNIGSHGTMVAGVAAAAGNNGVGIAGVAWDVRIMTVKVLDCGTGTAGQPQASVSDVADGIQYARLMGANIINLSLATPLDQPKLRAAIRAAQDAGIIVVAAAGNYGQNPSPGPGYPAAYTEFPNVIAVGSSNNQDSNGWASYSAYGPALDFAAPGNGIVSTARTTIGLASPYAAAAAGGTSFSTPMVSGMFALMMTRNSKLSAAEYIQIARDAATPALPAAHGQNWAGSGIINIGAAVGRVPMSVSGTALKDWKDVPNDTPVTATIDGAVCGSTAVVAFGPASPYSIRVKSALEQPGCGAPGKTVQFTVGGLPAVPLFTWGARDADIGMTGRDISSVSPAPGGIVVQTLNGGWSNIANFEPPGALPASVSSLPTPWTAIYTWDPVKVAIDKLGAYRRFVRAAPAFVNEINSLQLYEPFWVNAPASNVASVNPNPPLGRVIQLKPGWNNFVYTGTSKSVGEALTEVAGKYTEVAQYDNATSTWLLYHPPPTPRFINDFGGLFKLKVYWVYMTQAGSITMN